MHQRRKLMMQSLLALGLFSKSAGEAWSMTIPGVKTMKAENFFEGRLLAAYRLAQMGDTERLLQAAKSGQVNLNQAGKDDLTPLGFAVLSADQKAIISLMRAGADPNQVIPDAGSPAILAITKHHAPPRTEALSALLEGGYDPNQLLNNGKPYLFFFADYNHWPGLKMALERGGNINICNSGGRSLLAYILNGGDYAQARALILAGADVSIRGKRGESALEAVESEIRRIDPSQKKRWQEVLAMRDLILSKLPRNEDRHTAFTEAAEKKIRENR